MIYRLPHVSLSLHILFLPTRTRISLLPLQITLLPLQTTLLPFISRLSQPYILILFHSPPIPPHSMCQQGKFWSRCWGSGVGALSTSSFHNWGKKQVKRMPSPIPGVRDANKKKSRISFFNKPTVVSIPTFLKKKLYTVGR